MRRDHETTALAEPDSDELKPLRFLLLHVNASFFARLTKDLPQVQSELQSLADRAWTAFAERASPMFFDACRSAVGDAIDVSLTAPLAAADQACEQLFQAVLAIERHEEGY